jgi:hypothetical protein
VCVCVCVCARAPALVLVPVRVCVCVCVKTVRKNRLDGWRHLFAYACFKPTARKGAGKSILTIILFAEKFEWTLIHLHSKRTKEKMLLNKKELLIDPC